MPIVAVAARTVIAPRGQRRAVVGAVVGVETRLLRHSPADDAGYAGGQVEVFAHFKRARVAEQQRRADADFFRRIAGVDAE